eukprot:1747602-Pyramimonas_sp.AAC.1
MELSRILSSGWLSAPHVSTTTSSGRAKDPYQLGKDTDAKDDWIHNAAEYSYSTAWNSTIQHGTAAQQRRWH